MTSSGNLESMFPLIWRYLLQGYLKVFFLSICTFVSVLLVSRFKEIARFAALSGDFLKTGLFVLYQIPFIVPLALPICSLVASFLLFQRLSRSYELVAFRASGLGLCSLIAPPLAAAACFAFLNFSFCADISPFCWRESKALLYRETSANPLLLMQRQNLVKIKRAFLKMEVKKEGKEVRDFIFITHNGSNRRLNLFSARRLQVAKSNLIGFGLSILSHLDGEEETGFDPLIIENQAEMETEALVLSAALNKNQPRLEPNALSLRMLRIRTLESGKHGCRARIEILRRSSLSLAVFSFALLGCAFGMQQSRVPSRKGLAATLLLTLPVLTAYLGLKGIKFHFTAALLLSLLPHLAIAAASLFRIVSIARGKP